MVLGLDPKVELCQTGKQSLQKRVRCTRVALTVPWSSTSTSIGSEAHSAGWAFLWRHLRRCTDGTTAYSSGEATIDGCECRCYNTGGKNEKPILQSNFHHDCNWSISYIVTGHMTDRRKRWGRRQAGTPGHSLEKPCLFFQSAQRCVQDRLLQFPWFPARSISFWHVNDPRWKKKVNSGSDHVNRVSKFLQWRAYLFMQLHFVYIFFNQEQATKSSVQTWFGEQMYLSPRWHFLLVQ